jgi:hypothetical protein
MKQIYLFDTKYFSIEQLDQFRKNGFKTALSSTGNYFVAVKEIPTTSL